MALGSQLVENGAASSLMLSKDKKDNEDSKSKYQPNII